MLLALVPILLGILKHKFTNVASVVALIFGLITLLTGVPIAPEYVSAVVTVITGGIALYNAVKGLTK